MLAHKITRSDAATDCFRLQKNQLIQLALFCHGEAEARLGALVRDVDAGMFGHASALSQAMQSVNGDSAFEHRLTLLKLAAYDPGVLAAIHGPHFSKASKHPGFNYEGWRQALDQVWANYLPDGKSSRFHERIAMMAMYCGHWSLARRALQSGLQQEGPNATDLAQLAWCDARTGLLLRAADEVAEALALDQANVLAQEVMQRVKQRLAGWHGVWRQPLDHPALPLVLEPLDASHAEAMLYQYRDPQIAIMTGLPAITTLESMQQWISEQILEKTWAHYCIMHRDLGFVGYINLAISEHAAFFCFWTGVDFQGRGWATQAGKLVCDYARQSGVTVMLTSAYPDNQRSINALKRIGFSEIPIRAVPPDHERIFYALTSESVPGTDFVNELKNYYLREKISLSFPDADTGESEKNLERGR
jgi:RimJ/RimL family protein N-acetyltransferase